MTLIMFFNAPYLFAIRFVANEPHIELTPIDSESAAFAHNHFLVRVPINLVATLLTSPVNFLFGFRFCRHFSLYFLVGFSTLSTIKRTVSFILVGSMEIERWRF